MTTTAAAQSRSIAIDFFGAWPLVVGFMSLAIPTAYYLSTQTWSQEDGAQGPIVIATGSWLLLRQARAFNGPASGGSAWLTGLLMALGLSAYIAGRMFDFATFEAGGLFAVGVAMLHARCGLALLRAAWFPIVYLGFAIPPPSFVIDHLTAPLKHFAAFVATGSLSAVGLPIARQGVTIMVAQYQLLVEDACAGMNSIIGLTAISLLYIYLMRRASAVYALLLTLFVVPIAIGANIIRIVAILLITYVFGDEVGQSFIHQAAGLLLFATALILVFALDRVLHPVYGRVFNEGS